VLAVLGLKIADFPSISGPSQKTGRGRALSSYNEAMCTKALAGFVLTILAVVAGCNSSVELVSTSPAAGSGGIGGSGGQDPSGGSGGQSAAPYIEAAWIKVLPEIQIADAALDKTNHLLIVGRGGDPNPTIDGFPVAPAQTFAAKLNPEGKAVWLRSLSGPREARAIAIGPDDRVFVLSTTPAIAWGAIPPNPQWQKFYLTALGTDGEVLWEQVFGGDFDKMIALEISGADLVIDKGGNAIIATSISGHLDTPIGSFETALWDYDALFIRIAPDGSILQVKQFESPEGQFVSSVAIDAAGQFIATASLGGPEFVVKLDESFSPLWTRGFSGDGYVWALQVTSGKDNDVLVAGTFAGSIDFGNGSVQTPPHQAPFLLRFDSVGNIKDIGTYPDTYGDWGEPMALTANTSGEFAFSMQVVSNVDLGGGPVFNEGVSNGSALAKYSADGTYVSGTSIHGPGIQQTRAIALSPEGILYWVTTYWASLKYGDMTLVEPLPEASWGVEQPWGTAIFALPP